MRVRLGIVADDLTGADAVGAQLAETGLPSIVTSDPAALAAWAADLPAAVLNVDSRADGPERAAQKVRAAVAALREWGAHPAHPPLRRRRDSWAAEPCPRCGPPGGGGAGVTADALAVRAWGGLGGNALTAPTTGCYCGALSGSRSER